MVPAGFRLLKLRCRTSTKGRLTTANGGRERYVKNGGSSGDRLSTMILKNKSSKIANSEARYNTGVMNGFDGMLCWHFWMTKNTSAQGFALN